MNVHLRGPFSVAISSRLRSRTASSLFHQAGGMRSVVSFADPVPRRVGGRVLFPGHVGIIYQAANAVFTGRSTARRLTLATNRRAAQRPGEVQGPLARAGPRGCGAPPHSARCAPRLEPANAQAGG